MLVLGTVMVLSMHSPTKRVKLLMIVLYRLMVRLVEVMAARWAGPRLHGRALARALVVIARRAGEVRLGF